MALALPTSKWIPTWFFSRNLCECNVITFLSGTFFGCEIWMETFMNGNLGIFFCSGLRPFWFYKFGQLKIVLKCFGVCVCCPCITSGGLYHFYRKSMFFHHLVAHTIRYDQGKHFHAINLAHCHSTYEGCYTW
jgi:hypothetical protein